MSSVPAPKENALRRLAPAQGEGESSYAASFSSAIASKVTIRMSRKPAVPSSMPIGVTA